MTAGPSDPTARDLLPCAARFTEDERRVREAPATKLRHIAVGYDGSAASEEAVRWAVREAAGRDVMVLLVIACPTATTATDDERLTPMVQAFSAQQVAIARVKAALPDGVRPPLVGTEVVPADPVSALCRAARQADLLVLGSDRGAGLDGRSIPGRVAMRLSMDRHWVPGAGAGRKIWHFDDGRPLSGMPRFGGRPPAWVFSLDFLIQLRCGELTGHFIQECV